MLASTRCRSIVVVAVALASCSTTDAARRRLDPRFRHDDEPPPAPVVLSLIRVTSQGKEIDARRNALLLSDTIMRVKVQNHTGSSLLLKLDQTPDAQGVVPLDAATGGPGYSIKSDNLYKLDSDDVVFVDFSVRRGLREGHVSLAVTDTDGEKAYAEAKVSFRLRPVLEYYGDDELPFKTVEGVPQFGLDQTGEKAFYVEMIPGPPDGSTCVVALETTADDGAMLSQVRATLGTPAYRDGPFHAVPGKEVRPNAGRYGRADLADGDPADDVVSPPPRDRTDLIAAGELHVRRVVCQ